MSTSHFAQHRIRVTRIALVLAVLPLLFCASVWGERHHVFSESLFAVGIALAGIGVLGRVWCFSYISGRKQAELVTQGPYSLMRNPLYFFTMLGAVGIGFTSETMVLPVLVLLVFALTYPAFIRQEESALSLVHGAAFSQYQATTPRFWPSFARYDEPGEVMLNTRAFRRGLQDVIWFIVACGIFEILQGLHASGFIPVFLYLP